MPHPQPPPGRPDGGHAQHGGATGPHATGPRSVRRRLAGLRALVTGGSSGVGRAVALELARRGVRVMATARREPLLAGLAADGPTAGDGPAILHEAGDVTSADFRRRLVAATVERLGGLDILVTAAGSGAIGGFGEADPETLRRIMEVDFFAPAELVRESLPALRRGRDPAVVLVGSILAYHPLPLHAEYAAAKAALKSLAGSLRLELAADGIDVLLASLGPTESAFWDHLLSGSRPAWSRGRPFPAGRTATTIATALERRRGETLPGLRAKGFAIAARLFPRLIDAIVGRRFHRDADAAHNQRS